MQPRHRRRRAGHQADLTIGRAGGCYLLPQRLGCVTVMQPMIAQTLRFQREDDVLILDLVTPKRRNKLIRCPLLQEQEQRLQAGIFGIGQPLCMIRLEARMLVGRTLALARRDAEHI